MMRHDVDEDLSTKTRDKDGCTEVEAYKARASLLQTRLLSTLDTLDAIEASHEEELASILRSKEKLNIKLNRYIQTVNEVEAERDDLRDAVLKLVEKVEISNDYSSWPHSHIHIRSPVDPLMRTDRMSKEGDHQELLSSAAGLIESLRRERDLERAAHQQTKKVAESQIIALKAQLSRREAELEACIAHTKDCFPAPRNYYLMAGTHVPEVREQMSPEKAIKALSLTATKNKALELEIKTLFKQLEKARSAPAASRSKTLPPSGSTDAGMVSEVVPSLGPNTLQHTHVALDTTRTEENLQDFIHVTHDEPLTTRMTLVHHFDNQIKEFASKLDAFKSERNLLWTLIESGEAASLSSNEYLERLSAFENENVRLTRLGIDLRNDLDAEKKRAHAREQELLERIQLLIARIPRQHDTAMNQHDNAGHLLDVDEGEISMELATPLLPTTLILNESRPLSRATAERHAPTSVPLPQSPPVYLDPDAARSLPYSPIAPSMTFKGTPQPTDAEENLVRLEIELALAQRRLEDGEIALNELEHALDDFQLQALPSDDN